MIEGEEASVGFEVDPEDGGEFLGALAAFEWRFAGRNLPERDNSDPLPGTDVVSTIRDLAALRDDGILTREEFEQKKKELLSRL